MKASVVTAVTLASVAGSAFAGLTSVEEAIKIKDVSFEQNLGSRDVVVNYTLAGHNALIRAEVLTNGVSIGKQFIKTFTGDYSSTMTEVFEPGPHTFSWKARKDWPDQLTGDLQVKVCALYPEEAGKPTVYDEFARTVYANEFSVDNTLDEGWTVYLPGADAGGHGVPWQGRLQIRDRTSIGQNTTAQLTTPVFEELSDWRISFDLGLQCMGSEDWGNSWARWTYSISGLDADGNVVFKLVGQANDRGTNAASTIGGIVIPGTGSAGMTRLTLLRTAADTFSVFGPNGEVGTTSAAIANPKGKIVRLKFTIPEPVGCPATWGYGFVDNLKIEDISAAPF